MFALKQTKLPQQPPLFCTGEGSVVSGLREDVDYTIDWSPQSPGDRIFIDDVEITFNPDGRYHWRPAFYAGRVPADLIGASGDLRRYWLDVGPSPLKSGDECFAEMVRDIRQFDPGLLLGDAAAGMVFGREGKTGLFTDDVLLSRVRTYGPRFLGAVMEIVKVPHRALSSETHNLPLSRIRRLHPGALRDRRLLALAAGKSQPGEDLDSVQVRSLSIAPTFDTPANRSLVALLSRMLAVLRRLQGVVLQCGLGAAREEQEVRRDRRLAELGSLEARVIAIMRALPFSEVTRAQTSAAGLTQIAAQPLYSRAYRAGCTALRTGVEGDDQFDLLHVTPSWGIYETWCYLAVLRALAEVTGRPGEVCRDRLIPSQLAYRFHLGGGDSLDAFFQATFLAEGPTAARRAYSISRERRPDIVLVHATPSSSRAMVLDAKWRSGRDRILESMESAHIYHDALRFDQRCPEPCLILLPAPTSVPSLETAKFVGEHGVGALSAFAVGLPGRANLVALMADWLAAKGVPQGAAQAR
ncbi:DUF2357 domain-containing protein [Ramlibacter henchirensis]|uniref:DUF2357 domain-containing protein n=1 Tax=Ramlibacter henchirensis TaxID=204072 RepID=A0A4Z0BXC5_9BURK|nr:DUF2357 domain-containing protein [Ramlibacter henchirensis]TFZ02980.1 DUF2357 domain-containing protein [Ramlibacter henchirensis]